MAAFTVTLASVTQYDLTSASVNPQAYNNPTPRQGGFTIQNRIDFDSVTAPTATKAVANILKLVKIPPRTFVNNVLFAVPPGGATVAHKYTDNAGSALSGASAGKSVTLNVGYIWYKTAAAYATSTLSTSTLVQDTDGVADLAVTKKTGVAAGLPTAWTTTNASTVNANVVNMSDASVLNTVTPFPYGGWLVMQLTAGASASSVYGTMTGDLHVLVNAHYMPE